MVHKNIYKTLDDLSKDLDIKRKCVSELYEDWEIINLTYRNPQNTKWQSYFAYIPGLDSRSDTVLFSILLATIPAILTKVVMHYSNGIIAWISTITSITDLLALRSTFNICVGIFAFLIPIIIGLLWKQKYVTYIKYQCRFIYNIIWVVILIFTVINLAIDIFNIWK